VPRSYHEFAPAGKHFQRESAQIAAKPFFLMFRSSVLFRLFLRVEEKAIAMIQLTWDSMVLLELSWTTS
jgi:hypothetical protein